MKSTATSSPVLTEIAVQVLQDSTGLAALRLFPLFHTGPISASYYVQDPQDMTDVPESITRAPGTTFSRSQTKLSDDKYGNANRGDMKKLFRMKRTGNMRGGAHR
jgi:hypothetical protein